MNVIVLQVFNAYAGLLFVIAGGFGFSIFLQWSTNPDPASGRIELPKGEDSRADARLPWMACTLDKIAGRGMSSPMKAPQFANRGVYYSPLQNQIRVSRAICARMNDDDLTLILAHEIGHSTRRRQGWWAWTEAARLREEIFADAFALRATGFDAMDWLRAVQHADGVEPDGIDTTLIDRAKALGVSLQQL